VNLRARTDGGRDFSSFHSEFPYPSVNVHRISNPGFSIDFMIKIHALIDF